MSWSRARWAAVALVLASAGGLLWLLGPGGGEEPAGPPSGTVPDTAPGPGSWEPSPGRNPDAAPLDFGPSAASVSADDFVGAEACADCHAGEYRAWASSTHGNAGGGPAPDTVIAPFDGDIVRFHDAEVVPTVTPDGEYVFRVEWEGHGHYRLTVDGVVGKGHMLGGGTQGFFTRTKDGSYRFLPFDFSRTEGRWFCNTTGRRDRGWQPTENVELADCVDWPPSRALGNVRRLNNCQACHGSQIRVGVRRGRPHFDTRFESLRVNCESCHGPGRQHVQLARSGRIPGQEDIGIRPLAALGKDASLRVCFRCHALKTPLREGYLPGRDFRSHYALKLPTLGGDPYFPDGRIRTFAYQGTHLSSQCYLAGSMTCVDCHDPHSQEYRDHTGKPLSGPFDDGQCTSCHASKAEAPERHTRHPPDSEGSRCVACHMPYLQELQLGREIRYARSDHTIPVPRPAFDAGRSLDSLRLRSACGQCHEDRSPGRLQREADRWWGGLKPQDPLVRGLLELDSLREGGVPVDAGAAAARVLRPGEHDPVAQFQGLVRFVLGSLRPEMDSLPSGARRSLEELGRSPDLEVRALALASLHYARGDDPAVQKLLTARLHEARGRGDPLERRWAVILGFLGDRHRDAGEIPEAVSTYRKALGLRPGDADLHFALGRAHARGGNAESAIRRYRRALELEPDRALPHVNIGIVHASRGDEEEAMREYRAALEINPDEPLAHFNLGNLHLRAGRWNRAAESYRAALDRDLGMADAHFNLARALIRLERYREALASLRMGLEFRPEAESARDLARRLEEALSGG